MGSYQGMIMGKRWMAGLGLLGVASVLLGAPPAQAHQGLDPGREPRCTSLPADGKPCTDFATPPAGYVWSDTIPTPPPVNNKPNVTTENIKWDKLIPYKPELAKQPKPAVDGPALDYVSEVMEDARSCITRGGESMNCYVTATPQRCKQIAVNFIANPGQYRRTWYMCVRSCSDTSLWARTIGECRK